MPDEFGFDHLRDAVRCIDCATGGPIWRWPEPKRRRHARTHGVAPKQRTTDLRRQRSLLAAPPAKSNEEKEATMATKATGKGEPAKQVAIDILRKAGQPLHANEIAKRVLVSGRCAGLKGKTPEATISAMLAVGSKPGGPFTRVDKGTYTLASTGRSATTKPADQKPAATAPKRTPARKRAAARKQATASKRPRTKRSR